MAISLFDLDVTTSLAEQKEFFKDISDIPSNVQNKINQLDTLQTYQNHKNNEQIRTFIDGLINKAYPYMDISTKELTSGIKVNYLTRVFELAMFCLLNSSSEFNLFKRERTPSKDGTSNHPDYIFQHGAHIHYLECTTRSSSLMDKFFKLWSDFKIYLNVANIFNAKHVELTQLHGTSWDNTFWAASINMISSYFTEDEKQQIVFLLQAKNFKGAEEKFLSWIYYTRYARTLYKDLLNKNILVELEKINFPEGTCGDEKEDYCAMQHATNCVAQIIIDKTEKRYFHLDQPVTLAISFALPRNIFALLGNTALVSFIKENLERTIKNLLPDSESINNINCAIKNLYSIIIDTCWYNWLPEITKEHHAAAFPPGHDNSYICIYNSEHDLVKQGSLIYTQVPYHDYLTLNL